MKHAEAWRSTERLRSGLGKGDPFAAAVRAARFPVAITDPRQEGNPLVYVNDAFLNLTGYAREEIYGRNCRFLQGRDTDPAEVERIRAAIRARTDVRAELLNYRKDGSSFWNALHIAPVASDGGELLYFVALQLDVRKRRGVEARLRDENERIRRDVGARTRELHERTRELERTAASLQAALDSKTVLLHEVDHRVKNNLQIVAALISVQALRISDPVVKAALHSMLSRIEALSTVHRRLYQADDVSRFDVAAFAHDLVTDLVGATGREDIKVKLDLEPVEVPASQAAPLALVVNELVTNSLKHAFTGGRGGAIGVQVAQRDGDLRLEIADDGVGLAGSEPKPTSFGRNLIRTLARQLNATTVWHDANPGTRVEIRLPMATDRRDGASAS